MSAKLFKTFPNFCEILLKQLVWTLGVKKFRTIMVNIIKTYTIGKKETSDVASSNIVQHD